jgi:hypothetical protein
VSPKKPPVQELKQKSVILTLKEKMEMLNNSKRENISGELGSARIVLMQLAHPFSLCAR